MARNDAWRALTGVAAAQHGVFTKAQATEHGISARRLRTMSDRGLIERVHVGVYALAGATGFRSLCQAAVFASGGIISHRTAAYLHRFRCFDTVEQVEVVVDKSWARRVGGVIVHRWAEFPRSHITRIDGLPCTSLAATLVQLGAVVDDDAVEHALDDVLARKVSKRWIPTTLSELSRPGPSGSGALERVLNRPWRSSELPESWLERVITRLVHHHGLPMPRLQYEVKVRGRNFRLDLAYPEVLLGIAGHSRGYHFGPAKEAEDHERDLLLASVGWEVIYLTYWQAVQPDLLGDLLYECYQTRTAQLTGKAATASGQTRPQAVRPREGGGSRWRR